MVITSPWLTCFHPDACPPFPPAPPKFPAGAVNPACPWPPQASINIESTAQGTINVCVEPV